MTSSRLPLVTAGVVAVAVTTLITWSHAHPASRDGQKTSVRPDLYGWVAKMKVEEERRDWMGDRKRDRMGDTTRDRMGDAIGGMRRDPMGDTSGGNKEGENLKTFELFLKCLAYLKEKDHAPKTKGENMRQLLHLFKHVVWAVDELREYHDVLKKERLVATRESDDLETSMKKFFGVRDDDDNDGGNEEREVKRKILFFLFMKFSSHVEEMERQGKEATEDGGKKQFLLFVSFMRYGKEIQSRQEVLRKLTDIIEYKFKAKYTAFKRCLKDGICDGWDGGDEKVGPQPHQGQGQRQDQSGDMQRRFDEHFEIFYKMMKLLKDDGEGGRGGADGGSMIPADSPSHVGKVELLMKLHRHVAGKAKEFWGDGDFSRGEKMHKFVFFAFECYNHLQELRDMRMENTKIMGLFQKFQSFLEQYEDASRAKAAYAKFTKWRGQQKNQGKLDAFREYLQRAAIFKRMLADQQEQEVKEDALKRTFEAMMRQHEEKEKQDKQKAVRDYMDAKMKEHRDQEMAERETAMKRLYKQLKEQEMQENHDHMNDMLKKLLDHQDL